MSDPGELTFPVSTLEIEPWPDPVIDQLGHDPRSAYVERFWLGFLGPSTVLLLRRLADDLDTHPSGFTLDLVDAARSLGVGTRGGRHSPFMRTVERVCRFGAGQWRTSETLAVRRNLAPLTRGQIARLSPTLQAEHLRWVDQPDARAEVQHLKERARGLALSLLDLGEDLATVERQLHRWRFHPAIAHEAVRWACERRADAGPVPRPGRDGDRPGQTEEVEAAEAQAAEAQAAKAQAARMAAAWPAQS